MLRRLLLTLYLLLALASAVLWVRSYRVIDAASYQSRGLVFSLLLQHGGMKLLLRTTDGDPRGAGV